jgi:hypothetical protein
MWLWRSKTQVTGPALLAVCRLVALLDELHDCLEEAPSALDPAAATRLLGRLCTISRTHVRLATLRAAPLARPARADLVRSELAKAGRRGRSCLGGGWGLGP